MKKISLFLAALFFMTGPALGREIAGVTLEEQTQVKELGTTLTLNGAGIRKKFFFKIYVAGLYLSKRSDNAEAVIASPGPKQVRMHFLYSEVEKEKLTNGWNEGFEANHGETEMAALRQRLDRFNALFDTVREGDLILLDYLPERGTRVTVNGTEKGIIEGADFNQALLRVWLGKSPVTSSLKEALLGK